MQDRFFDVVPAVGGGLFTGPQASPAGINKPRWARINDSAGENPVRYGWEEQTFQALQPGANTSIGFVKSDAGMNGTVDLNPIVEPNGKSLAVGDYVLVRAEYFDTVYDTVFTVVNNGALGGGSGMEYAKSLQILADASGRYNARLQVRGPEGVLIDSGPAIWLREAQNMGALTDGGIYMCSLTGFAAGRYVYTVADFLLTVANESQGQFILYASTLAFVPDRCWDLQEAALRIPYIKRLLNVLETSGTVYDDIYQFTFDPATNWEVDDADDDGDVIVRRVLDIYEGATERTTYTYKITFDGTDFDVAATAAGHATVNTNGFTGTRDNYRYCCVTGTLYEVSATVSVTNGLVKAWATMPTCP